MTVFNGRRVHIRERIRALGKRLAAVLFGCFAFQLATGQLLANDFETRRTSPGVFRYFDFDSQAEADPHIRAPHGLTTKRASIVTDVKASGAGSLRFDVPSNTGADTSGSFWLNFADDLSIQFGEGDEFFVQWRQRFSPAFLNAYGGGGWKQAIVGEGDRPGEFAPSCTQLEVVLNCDTRFMGPKVYHSCGGKDGRYESLEEWDSSLGNIVTQNVVGCLYPNYDAPPCVVYKADQWMTFQMQITIGTWYENDGNYHRDSTVRLWVAEEGEPSKLILDFSPERGNGYDLANDEVVGALYGKIWLLPYNTGKDNSIDHPTAYTWYDELILSTERIPDPVPGSEDDPPQDPPDDPPPPDDEPSPPAETDSALGTLVEQMEPGDWRVLDTNGFTFDLLDACDGSHSILAWSNTGEWFSRDHEFHFIGQGHYACQKHIVYSVATNSWTTLPLAQTPEIGHGYEHNALDPATGDVFYRVWNSMRIMKRSDANQSWSALPEISGLKSQVASALEFFPDMGSGGSLILVDSVAGVWAFDVVSQEWNELSTPLAMGPYHLFSAYNPTHRVILFGGGNGSTDVYRLDADGTITTCERSPVECGIKRAIVEFEPNTGKYLAFADNGSIYEYDVGQDRWARIGNHPVMSYATDWRVGAALRDYGVFMFLAYDFGNSKVLIYKHADGISPPPPPPPPDDDPPDDDPPPADSVAPAPPIRVEVR